MPIDPSIPLQVKTPEPASPLTTIGGIMQLRDMMSQVGLRQAQTEQAQQQSADLAAQAKQRERLLQDQTVVQQAMSNPDTAKAIGSGDFSSLQGKVTPSTLFDLQTKVTDHQKSLAALDSDTLKNRGAAYGQIEDAINGLREMKGDDGKLDLGLVNASLPDLVQQLSGAGVFRTAGIPTPKIGPITDPKDLDQWLAKVGALQGANDKALSESQTKSEIAKNTGAAAASNAEADLSKAKTPGATAESQKQQLITAAMKRAQAAQQTGQHPIDSIMPASTDKAANASYKAAYDTAMANGGPEAANHVVEAAAGHAATIAMANNPQVRAGEVAKAVATAVATAPIETAKAIATAKALRQGDNPAVAGVAPAAVGQVQNQAINFDKEYIKAREATESIGRLLDLAQSGNKAAGSNLPLVGVETLNAINGIKRINSAEISQYGTAGSLLDVLKGKFEKLTVGKPIPQDVLNDIRQLHQSLGDQAYRTYTSNLDTLNQRTGSKFAPTVDPPNIRPGVGQILVKAGDGSLHPFDSEAQAQAFEQLVRGQGGTTTRQ